MDVIKFFEDVETKFNAEQKCGECWVFKAPMSESGMNATKLAKDEICCIKMFMTAYSYSSGYVRNNATGLQRTGYCDYIFTLHVVKEHELGINVYEEQPGHDIDESIWRTVLRPIEQCLGCGHEFDLCALGYDFDIIKWNMVPVIFAGDNNYVGWRIDAIFREYQ